MIKTGVTIGLLIIGLLLWLSLPVTAKTYYIDYAKGRDANKGLSKDNAWKSCPALQGFNGTYTHRPGDVFVFKGGVTWPASVLPFKISNSGTAANNDIYTSDSSWYQGDSFQQPFFTAEHKQIPLVYAEKQSFFAINGLHFADFGTSGVANHGKGIEIMACGNYTLSNCTIAPQAWLGLYLHSYSGSLSENITIENNDISSAGQAIVICTEAANTILKNVTITKNHIHDLSSQIVGETHGDGIHTWNSPESDTSQYITRLVISYNRFDGDFSRTGPGTASMTALIYLTDPGRQARIFNNTLTYSKATSFASLIWIRYFDDVRIYNNTLVQQPALGGIAIMVGQGNASENVVITNNTLSGCQSAYYIYIDATPSIRIDSNRCHTTSMTIGYWNETGRDAMAWRALGNDVNGLLSE